MAKENALVQNPIDSLRQTAAKEAIAPPSRRHTRALIFQWYMIFAIAVFLVLAVFAHTVAYFTFDVSITHAVQSIKTGWVDTFMYSLSWIGFAPQEWIISVVILLFLYASGLKWETVVTLVSVVGSSVLDVCIKLIVERPRPSAGLVDVINQLKDYSFPSGHVMYFTTFFGFLLFLAYALLKPSWWRLMLLVTLGAMVSLIGISRIYEGQHWASDVLAAYLIGSVWLGLSIYIYRWGKTRYFVNQPVAKERPAQNKSIL